MIKTIIVENAKSDAENLRNSSDSISDDELIQRTKGIMGDIEKYGDSAIMDYEEKFDGVRLNSLKVTDEEMREAYNKVTKKQIQSIKMIRNRLIKTEIALFKQLQKKISFSSNGVNIQRTIQPISSVGCYVPGGKARYPSTMVMCAVPAKVAGVNRIVAISPPLQDGTIDPLTLVSAEICGVNEFYKIGGAQGIAALTFGTQSINKVNKIVGPGGIFVSIAKALASTRVSIDMVAGPTELVVYADAKADARLIAMDMISQAEHSYDTFCGLVTTSKELALQVNGEIQSILNNNSISRIDIVRKSLEENGFIAICENEYSAVEFINEVAPEHLEIMAKNARTISTKITSAGLILIGNFTPSSASDYCLGSNHVLPTSGFGKVRSSLSVLDFIKIVNKVEATRSGLKKVESKVREITLAEGLMNHYEAIKERIK
ncbi:MAG TPA: histidinol dehydrogenase [Nitrososphaeraceae archaeon]|nr:histidinol dehydrogenase [Nitrososphaeraceae archaeon]